MDYKEVEEMIEIKSEIDKLKRDCKELREKNKEVCKKLKEIKSLDEIVDNVLRHF